MGKAHPHIPEDPPGSGMALPGQLLHLPQLLSRGQGRICGNSCGSGQPDHGVLRKVLPPYAGITGPRVSGGRLCQIHRRKGQLIEPAGDTALCIHIARRLTGPHSDAHDGAGAETHIAR